MFLSLQIPTLLIALLFTVSLLYAMETPEALTMSRSETPEETRAPKPDNEWNCSIFTSIPTLSAAFHGLFNPNKDKND